MEYTTIIIIMNMTRNDVINLFATIRDIKAGDLDKDTLIKFILLRVKLKDISLEFDKVRQEIADQTKPEGWKEGDDMTEWNSKFQPILTEWLKEEVDLNVKILSEEDLAVLLKENKDRFEELIEVLTFYMLKEDKE